MQKKRKFNSGLRKYFDGYGDQNLRDDNGIYGLNRNNIELKENVFNQNNNNPYDFQASKNIFDNNGQLINNGVSNKVEPVNKVDSSNNAIASSIVDSASGFISPKNKEGTALATTASTALGAGALASSLGAGGAAAGGAAGAGGTALGAGITAAAAPVAIAAGAALGLNQIAKAIGGKRDEYGVYKSDAKASYGGFGNIVDTHKSGAEMVSNADNYAYLSGEGKGKVKSAGRISQIPIFGWADGARSQNKIRRKARDRAQDLEFQNQRAQETINYDDSLQHSRDIYGTTFADGGLLSNNNSYFKAGGSTHEKGGVDIGNNKEIEKDEVVHNGYVFSNRLLYKKK